MQTIAPTLADLVSLAFGDVQDPPLPVSIPEFLTERLDRWTDLEMCLNAIGIHKSFDPAVVAGEIQPIFPELMDVRIGRQADVLIVAEIPFWTNQAIGWQGPEDGGRRLARRDREALGEKVEAAFKRSGGGVGSLIDDDFEGGPALLEISGHWVLPRSRHF